MGERDVPRHDHQSAKPRQYRSRSRSRSHQHDRRPSPSIFRHVAGRERRGNTPPAGSYQNSHRSNDLVRGPRSASRIHIELNKQISTIGGAAGLCALIEARGAAFNHVNVSTAFRKLLPERRAGVPKGAVEDALRVLEAAALRTMAEFQAQNVASTLHIMAKTRYRPADPRLLLELDRKVEELVREFNVQSVSTTLWAYATMGREPEERVMGMLEERVGEVLREYHAQNVANTLWAYAKMGRAPGERVMGMLERRMGEVVREYQAQNVANTLWAYAKMGREPGGAGDGYAGGESRGGGAAVQRSGRGEHAVGVREVWEGPGGAGDGNAGGEGGGD